MNRKLTIPQLIKLCDHAILQDCDGHAFKAEAAENALGLIHYEPCCDEGPRLLEDPCGIEIDLVQSVNFGWVLKVVDEETVGDLELSIHFDAKYALPLTTEPEDKKLTYLALLPRRSAEAPDLWAEVGYDADRGWCESNCGHPFKVADARAWLPLLDLNSILGPT